MPTALTDQDAVTAALLRPLTDFEITQLDELVAQAENALRTRLPTVDDRMGQWTDDPTVRPVSAIDPAAVRRVLAGVIRRKMANPAGAASVTAARTDAEFSRSQTTSFAFRGQAFGKGNPGELEVTDADLASLVAKPSGLPSTIRVSPPVAPVTGISGWPYDPNNCETNLEYPLDVPFFP